MSLSVLTSNCQKRKQLPRSCGGLGQASCEIQKELCCERHRKAPLKPPQSLLLPRNWNPQVLQHYFSNYLLMKTRKLPPLFTQLHKGTILLENLRIKLELIWNIVKRPHVNGTALVLLCLYTMKDVGMQVVIHHTQNTLTTPLAWFALENCFWRFSTYSYLQQLLQWAGNETVNKIQTAHKIQSGLLDFLKPDGQYKFGFVSLITWISETEESDFEWV